MSIQKKSIKRTTVILASFAAALVAMVFMLGYVFSRLSGPVGGGSSAVTTAPQLSPQQTNTFRPTKLQWESLHTAVVSTAPFRAVLITDGTIAINDNKTVNIFSPYSGRVARVIAQLGETVKKGDPIMTVEASEFVQGQNDLIAASSTLNTAMTQFHLAQKTETRQHELLLAKAGAQKDWLQSQSDLTAAQNAVRTAEIGLGAVRNRLRILGKSIEEIAALEQESNAQRYEATAVVKAPIGGTIVLRQVGPGQYIQSASGGAAAPFFAISDLSSVWLIANLRETDVALVRVGQAVEVHVPAFPSRTFAAKLSWVSPLVDPATHRVPVRAEIDNRDRALKPAMLANFTIVTGMPISSVSVPQSAVVYEGSSAHVFIAHDDGTIGVRTVEVGKQYEDLIEVTSGLKGGEKIITSGALFIDRAVKGSAA